MNRIRLIVILVLSVFIIQLSPVVINASGLEKVYVNKVMDSDYKAIITRSNGDMYLIEYGIGVISLWLFEGRYVHIYSPGMFAGVGSKIMILDRDQDARIWSSEYIGTEEQSYNIPSVPVLPSPVYKPSTTVFFSPGFNKYMINGQFYDMDVVPYIRDGRIFMPVRYVAYGLGVDEQNVIWDDNAKTVTLMKGDKVVQVMLGSMTMLINGVLVAMDAAPEISDGRVMLPARFIAQAFGATVGWDSNNNTMTISY